MKALILAETESAARELAAGARIQADRVILVSIGSAPVVGVADQAYELEIPSNAIIEDAYVTINEFYDLEQPELIFVEPSRNLKVIAGRLAAHIGTSVITDVIEFAEGAATNLYFGGLGQRSYQTQGKTAIYTVGGGVFDGSMATGTDVVASLTYKTPARAIVRIDSKPLEQGSSNLAKNDVVVVVGRGFAEKEELDIAQDLADKIGGDIGCTRPLTEGVDWLPKGSYLGVSGLTITPKLLFSVGVSGQMQHMVGCNRAGTIVAINKDKSAPIFKQADIGIVGDLKNILPALSAAL